MVKTNSTCLYKFWLTITLLFTFSVAEPVQSANFIPTESEYYPFLVNGWDPKRKTVLVFKDPYCPYCINAISDIEKLTKFNVFVFWAPILGERSKQRVDDIFQCRSPVNKRILDAMMVRKSPNCDRPINHKLKALNQRVVDNYNIFAVPSIFISGKQVSLAQLMKESNKRPAVNGVQVNWKRFKLMQQDANHEAKTLALLIPNNHPQVPAQVVDSYKPEFVFLANKVIEQRPRFLKCKSDNLLCLSYQLNKYKAKYQEFTLLFGTSIKPERLMVIDRNGKVSYP
ncbi:thioredoxin fold domain-containing protein [Psychrobium sp. 1_MG-2023]|uniref:thioredoxin fold domain-containing protein n=1 Tax=Psychrobium sp. 1_MG-2023 TaxID=3062624 RepID=UPI00273746DE|nr:thioredoxin fold domain-containing protein [Psychrobium sp. 1_MG-2023]MDP2560624.1 thioredoxin fold domain-containing protein [Psychrobium sp. 1_MG-2023]